MNTEAFEMTIEKSREELEKRPARKNITMIAIALILFFGAAFLFFNQPDSVYKTAYAPLLVGWLMICVWIGHVISSAMFISRSVELQLSIETASTILELAKERENDNK